MIIACGRVVREPCIPADRARVPSQLAIVHPLLEAAGGLRLRFLHRRSRSATASTTTPGPYDPLQGPRHVAGREVAAMSSAGWIHISAIEPNTVVKVVKEVPEEDKDALLSMKFSTSTISRYPIWPHACSFDEIADAAHPGQPLFLQLYVNRDRESTKKYVEHAEKWGVKALLIAVGAPQLGRRDKDMMVRARRSKKANWSSRRIEVLPEPLGPSSILVSHGKTFLVHIILKGVATPEDAILAYEAG
ncbi:hypothetical protein BJ912DRAFT_1059275 [Pholiota molesta]|nr:hypothetical protein BJ912DRAFT_1059275 [Pholiota molesta]